MLNAFRLLADLSHVVAILLLLLKIVKTKSVAGACSPTARALARGARSRLTPPRRASCSLRMPGISLKAQALFALVFLTRYVDLFWNFHSVYNTVMKVIFIATSVYTCYLIAWRFRATYDIQKHDTLRVEFIIVPCVILAFIFNEEFTPFEVGGARMRACARPRAVGEGATERSEKGAARWSVCGWGGGISRYTDILRHIFPTQTLAPWESMALIEIRSSA